MSTPGSSDLTGKYCTKLGIQWTWDGYAATKVAIPPLLAKGVKKWFFITPDYNFGHSVSADARRLIEASGGRVEHFGMPVDPGNLLLLAERAGIPIIGAPGCARSPKENGFDWVLQRVLAAAPVRDADIRAMGVGGLLMEIGARPQPRASIE